MESLRAIYERHRTGLDREYAHGDKGTVHSYIGIYEDLLAPFRERPCRLLEVGIADGHSLRMWREYLPLADIHGMDIADRAVSLAAEGITVHVVDSTSHLAAELLGGTMYDIIIDDGSHLITDQLLTYQVLSPHLVAGGVYVIEDLEDLDQSRELLTVGYGMHVVDLRAVKGRHDDALAIWRTWRAEA